MPSSLRVDERERIYGVDKIVDGSLLVWRQDNGAFRLSAPVVCSSGEELVLKGVKAVRRYSFTLLYGVSLIRRWDYKRHRNPDEVLVSDGTQGHKHPKEDKESGRWAYRVLDVPTNDVDEALMAFLKECNVTVEGHYQRHLVGRDPGENLHGPH